MQEPSFDRLSHVGGVHRHQSRSWYRKPHIIQFDELALGFVFIGNEICGPGSLAAPAANAASSRARDAIALTMLPRAIAASTRSRLAASP